MSLLLKFNIIYTLSLLEQYILICIFSGFSSVIIRILLLNNTGKFAVFTKNDFVFSFLLGAIISGILLKLNVSNILISFIYCCVDGFLDIVVVSSIIVMPSKVTLGIQNSSQNFSQTKENLKENLLKGFCLYSSPSKSPNESEDLDFDKYIDINAYGNTQNNSNTPSNNIQSTENSVLDTGLTFSSLAAELQTARDAVISARLSEGKTSKYVQLRDINWS